jgi:hypothetical protein
LICCGGWVRLHHSGRFKGVWRPVVERRVEADGIVEAADVNRQGGRRGGVGRPALSVEFVLERAEECFLTERKARGRDRMGPVSCATAPSLSIATRSARAGATYTGRKLILRSSPFLRCSVSIPTSVASVVLRLVMKNSHYGNRAVTSLKSVLLSRRVVMRPAFSPSSTRSHH